MKKIVIMLMMGLFLSGAGVFIPVTGCEQVSAATTEGFVTSNGNLYYYQNGERVKSKLMTINGDTYYFQSGGAAASGRTTVNGKIYYFDPTTHKQKTGIVAVSYSTGVTQKHYFLKDGGLYSGWVTVSGKKYYFSSASTGAVMLYGVQKIDGNYYHFDVTTGAAKTGWVTYEGNRFYHDPATGARLTGFQTIDGATYYFNTSNGAALSGLQTLNKKYYYFDPTTYKQKIGFVTITYSGGNTATHYFLKDGGAQSGWLNLDGKKYYFYAQDGASCMLYGEQEINGKMYYFDKSTGEQKEGIFLCNNGKRYYFAAEGGVKEGLQTWNEDIYYCNALQSGEVQYGFQSVGEDLYFFDLTTGAAWKNTSFNYGNIIFTIGSDGVVSDITVKNGYENNERIKLIMNGLSRLGEEDVYCGAFTKEVSQTSGLTEVTGASYEQAKAIVDGEYGTLINQSELRLGDLVFWRWDNCGVTDCEHWEEIHHVGFYLGNGKILEAASTTGEVSYGGMVQVRTLRSYEGYEVVYCARIADDTSDDFLDTNLQCATLGSTKNIKAVSAGKNKVTLTWDAVKNADGYLIYAQKSGTYKYCGMTTGESNITYTDKKALDSDYNFYWVFPYKYNSAGKMCTGASGKYVYAKGITTAVTGLKASSVTGAVSLSWNSVADAEGYLVYGIVDGKPYGYVGMTTKGTTLKDAKASKTNYNYYWVFPYHRDANGKMIIGGTAKYTYGRAK